VKIAVRHPRRSLIMIRRSARAHHADDHDRGNEREPYQPVRPIQRSSVSSCRPACSRPWPPMHRRRRLRVVEEKGRPGQAAGAGEQGRTRAVRDEPRDEHGSGRRFGRIIELQPAAARQPDAAPYFSARPRRTPANRKARLSPSMRQNGGDDHPRQRRRPNCASPRRAARLPGTGSPLFSRNTPANTTA